MAKRKRNHTPGTSYTYLKIFLLCVGLLLLLSVILKIAAMIARSQFDNHNRFTIAFCCQNTIAQIISLAPDDSSGSLLLVHNATNSFGKTIEIPIDEIVSTQSIDLSTHSLSSLLFHQLITNTTHSLTWYDKIRMYLFAQSLRENNISFKELSLPLPDDQIDMVVSQLFKDNKINVENKSIQIINASDVPGVGNRLARLIVNTGGNVVSVVTASNPQKTSSIAYSGTINYTTEKLHKFLKYKEIQEKETSLSDITITIGEDNSFISF